MMPPADQAPPSYRTATNAYNQPQPPSGPYYQSGAESIPSAPFYQPY